MVILVYSCDKNKDLWTPFNHCIEKYWKDHPKVIYKTEKLKNPYYETITANYPMNEWTKGIREVLDQIDDKIILFMADDIFIRRPVDIDRLKYAIRFLEWSKHGANFNLEKSFDLRDKEIKPGISQRCSKLWKVSIMCGLWKKEALKKILTENTTPWDIEEKGNDYGYDYYINSGDYIIDWGYSFLNYAGIKRGKWCKEAKYFFDNEGVNIDYEKRGFVDDNYSTLQ